MNVEFEDRLRAALKDRAEQIPDRADARVRERAYPVRGSRARGVGVAGCAVAVGGLTFGLMLAGVGGHGAQQASAGWTPVPTGGTAARTAAAEAVCRADLPTSAQARRAREAMPLGGDPALEPAGGDWRTVLVDTRGSYTMVLLVTGGAWQNCLVGPSVGGPPAGGGGQANEAAAQAAAPAGQIKEMSSGFSRLADRSMFSYVSGKAGTGVRTVSLTLDDGTRVQASVGGGWFVAWWPGSRRVKTLQVGTAAGVVSQTTGAIDRAGQRP